ncbi:hypothetical protein JQ287_00890 [Helicobacter pylori]|nr:hypothetical protein [Helicobacter pylori]
MVVSFCLYLFFFRGAATVLCYPLPFVGSVQCVLKASSMFASLGTRIMLVVLAALISLGGFLLVL